MTIKLNKNNKIQLFLNKKSIDDSYVLTFKHQQTNELFDFIVFDYSPAANSVYFEFEFENLLEGSYTYSLVNGDYIYKTGLAYHKTLVTKKEEYNYNYKKSFYDGK